MKAVSSNVDSKTEPGEWKMRMPVKLRGAGLLIWPRNLLYFSLCFLLLTIILFNIYPFYSEEPYSPIEPLHDPTGLEILLIAFTLHSMMFYLLLAVSVASYAWKFKGRRIWPRRVKIIVSIVPVSMVLLNLAISMPLIFENKVSLKFSLGGAIVGFLFEILVVPLMLLAVYAWILGRRIKRASWSVYLPSIVAYVVLFTMTLSLLGGLGEAISSIAYKVAGIRGLYPYYFRGWHPGVVEIVRENHDMWNQIMPSIGKIVVDLLLLLLAPLIVSRLAESLLGISPAPLEEYE